MQTTNQRLKEYIDSLGLSVRNFAEEVGISHSTIYNSSNVGSDVLARIKARYQKLSLDWLVCGTGPMEVGTGSMVMESAPIYEKPGNGGTPFYDVPFTPALFQSINSGKAKPTAHFSTPLFPNIEFWVRAAGSGLEPLIPAGAAIGLKLIQPKVWQKWLPPGEAYVILTEDFALARIVHQSDDQEKLALETLQSTNGSKQYLPISLVQSIYKVVTITHEFH